jgi:hypothetical protein
MWYCSEKLILAKQINASIYIYIGSGGGRETHILLLVTYIDQVSDTDSSETQILLLVTYIDQVSDTDSWETQILLLVNLIYYT